MVDIEITAVDISDETKSRLSWFISEVGQAYDLSSWHFFVYGYPDRKLIDVRITAPDGIRAHREFTSDVLTALGIRAFVEDEYQKWQSRKYRKEK